MSSQIIKQLACLQSGLTSVLNEILVAVGANAPTPDYEIVTTSWLCDEGGTDTWTRTETTYVDGVASAPVIIDSGIACNQPSPPEVGIDVELVCNAATGFYDSVLTTTTDGVPAAPVVTPTTISCAIPDSIQAIQLPDVCVTVDGGTAQYATPITLFNQSTGLFAGNAWLDNVGIPITGVVVATDPCDCPCLDCGVLACILVQAFDVDRGAFTPGDTSTFVIQLDGVTQATIIHDYATTFDGTNVSTFYDPIIAAVNAVPDWSMTLETDVNFANDGKVTWRVEYSGNTAQVLDIDYQGGTSVLTFSADGAGNIVGTDNWPGGTSPFSACI